MWFGRFQEGDVVAFNVAALNGKDGIGARRHRRSGHDADRLAGLDIDGIVDARSGLKPNDVEGERVRGFVIKATRKTVHGRIVKRRVVDSAGQVLSQYSVGPCVNGDGVDAQWRRRLKGDGPRFFDRDEVRTVIHGPSKEGSCLRLWVNGRMMVGGSMHLHG